jgi:hypothetical protein
VCEDEEEKGNKRQVETGVLELKKQTMLPDATPTHTAPAPIWLLVNCSGLCAAHFGGEPHDLGTLLDLNGDRAPAGVGTKVGPESAAFGHSLGLVKPVHNVAQALPAQAGRHGRMWLA